MNFHTGCCCCHSQRQRPGWWFQLAQYCQGQQVSETNDTRQFSRNNDTTSGPTPSNRGKVIGKRLQDNWLKHHPRAILSNQWFWYFHILDSLFDRNAHSYNSQSILADKVLQNAFLRLPEPNLTEAVSTLSALHSQSGHSASTSFYKAIKWQFTALSADVVVGDSKCPGWHFVLLLRNNLILDI